MKNNSALNDEAIIKKYSKTVYKIAYSIVQNKDDADDVFQNVFLKYIKKHPRFNDETHEKAWFIRVTMNTAKSFVIQAWYKNTEAISEQLVYAQNDKFDLDFAIKQLNPRDRTIIYLFYYEGYKTDEIAKIMKMTSAAVRTALSRTRNKLKIILEKEGYNGQ